MTFSVVIPLYNKESTILRTLASVLHQTFQDFEIVVVDDGSSDGSAALVERHALDPRVRLIRQPNQGVSAARNAGVAASRGAYVAFLDADDEWLPNFLLRMQEAVVAFPEAGILGCPSWHRDFVTGEADASTLGRYRGRIQLADYLANPFAMPHTSAMVVKREVFVSAFPDGEGFPRGMRLNEDWACFHRLAFRTPFVYVGFPLGVRNNNVGGQITASAAAARRALLPHEVRFYNLVALDSRAAGVESRYRRFFAYALRTRILAFLRAGDPESAGVFLNGLTNEAASTLGAVERFLYGRRALRMPARAWILATKLAWRCHRHPMVGRAW